MRGALGFDFVFEVIGAVLEDDEVVAVFVLFNVVEFDDVGGGDFLEELDFVLHDFDGGGGVFGAQDFDGEFLFGLGGVAEVDLAVAAFAQELGGDDVGAQLETLFDGVHGEGGFKYYNGGGDK